MVAKDCPLAAAPIKRPIPIFTAKNTIRTTKYNNWFLGTSEPYASGETI